MYKLSWMSPIPARDLNGTIEYSYDTCRGPFHKDFGAITYSNFFKRLSKKTQVYSLPTNDHVRNRLTHSLEVAQIGRHLARYLCKKLSENNKATSGVHQFSNDFEELTAAACLAHDIGHPPFGHEGASILNRLTCKEKKFLVAGGFDDNKQAAHILLSEALYETINPSACLVASVLKKFDVNKNVYSSEVEYTKVLLEKLQLTNLRHPASILMEAADDIAYICSDIEDYLDYYIEYKNFQLLSELAHALESVHLTGPKFDYKSKDSWMTLAVQAKGVTKDLNIEKFRNYLMRAMISHVMRAIDTIVTECPTIEDLPKVMKTFIEKTHHYIKEENKYDDNLLYWGNGEGTGAVFYNVKKICYHGFVLNDHRTSTQSLLAQSVLTETLDALWPLTSPDYADSFEYKSLSPSVQSYIKYGHNNPNLGAGRAVIDYLSGMTDTFVLKELEKLRPVKTRLKVA